MMVVGQIFTNDGKNLGLVSCNRGTPSGIERYQVTDDGDGRHFSPHILYTLTVVTVKYKVSVNSLKSMTIHSTIYMIKQHNNNFI